MRAEPTGPWFARVLGGSASLLALSYLLSCVLVPLAGGDQVFFGVRLLGPWGWLASATHGVFFAWVAYLCFTRKALAAPVVVGYCVYLIENIWIYCAGEGRPYFPNTMAMLSLNALVTALLLVFARIVLSRRSAFDR